MTESTSGPLGVGVLPPVLGRLNAERRTGLLHVRHDKGRVSVCLIEGEVAWADTTIREYRLGDTMVRYGRLDPKVRELASEQMIVSRRRFGQVLVDMGVFDDAGLQVELGLHAHVVLRSTLAWTEGAWEFSEMPPDEFRGFHGSLDVAIVELVTDAVNDLDDAAVRAALGERGDPLVLGSATRLSDAGLLSTEDGFLLSRIDGTVSVKDVLEIVPANSERRLLALLWTRAIQRRPKPNTGRFPRPVVLKGTAEVGTGTGWFQVPVFASAPPRAEAAAPVAPAAPAPPAPSAEEIVVSAEKAMAEGQRYEALAAIDDVLPRTEGPARVRARLLRARILLKDRARMHEADHELRTLLEETPENADAYYLQGLIAKRAGVTKRAQSLFGKAVELNPKHTAARNELQELSQESAPASAQNPGLLQRLFSKSG